MHYRSEIWVSQYKALMDLHLLNGGHMDNMEHLFGDEFGVKWERLDYGRGSQKELMLYTFHNPQTLDCIQFKVSTGDDGYVYELLKVVERGIVLCHGKEDQSINCLLKNMLWPTILAFDTIWFD